MSVPPAAGAGCGAAPGPRFPINGVGYSDVATTRRLFASGAWTESTMGATLGEAAGAAGNDVALVAGGDRLTWDDLNRRTDNLAVGLLELGLRPGDRIMVQMGTGPAIVLGFFACWKAGVIPVCAVPTYRAYEIGALAERSGAVAHLVEPGSAGRFDLVAFAAEVGSTRPQLRHLIVAGPDAPAGAVTLATLEEMGAANDPVRRRALLDAAAPDPGDVFAFQLSGGSTGIPKIIPRFHGEYLASAASWADRLEMTDADVLLWPLSLAHNAGMILMLIPALVRRARLVLLPRFELDQFLAAIRDEQVTVTGSIGPIGPRLLQTDLDRRKLPALRYFFGLNRAGELERHLGVPCANMFGITEGLLMGSAPDDPATVRHSSVGRPTSLFDEVRILSLDGTSEVPVGEVGELCFRGPSSLVAYVGSDEGTTAAFTADGFFRTGDLVRAAVHDGEASYVFEGRTRENIDRGGEKFGVAEIEELLSRHPAVTEARVVGMPCPELGERVCAFLLLAPGAAAPTADELGTYLLASGLAKFKLPERIEVVADFPVTAVGKLDRAALRPLAAAPPTVQEP